MNHYRLLLLKIAVKKYREDTQGLQCYTEYRTDLLIQSMHRRAIHEYSQSEVFRRSKQNP